MYIISTLSFGYVNMISSCRARREQLKNKGEVKKEEPSPSFADAIAKEYERSVRQSPPF